MDVPFVIRRRLAELGLEQKDLARAARVTESYVSQLLSRKRLPPAPDRSDIYDRMERLLELPDGELARLAVVQRTEELKRELGDEPVPLFREVRDLILRKCRPDKTGDIRAIFERQPFGELERLVTQYLLDVVKRVVREQLSNERWLRAVARRGGRSFEEMRVSVLEFLDTDLHHVSVESCVSFLDPVIESWDIDLTTFALEIVLRAGPPSARVRRLEFVERPAGAPHGEEPGLKEFLRTAALSGTATPDEIAFLRGLRFDGRRPTALYYYRELQNLRDPLHFTEP